MTDEKIIARMQADQEQGWPLCPRCGERMPDKLTYGALSRHAKGVYICEACADEVLRKQKIPLHFAYTYPARFAGLRQSRGGFLRAAGAAKYKIKSGPCRATLYKSRSFSSGSILAGVYVSVKPFWYSAPRS